MIVEDKWWVPAKRYKTETRNYQRRGVGGKFVVNEFIALVE
jgi:hypothetical protein